MKYIWEPEDVRPDGRLGRVVEAFVGEPYMISQAMEKAILVALVDGYVLVICDAPVGEEFPEEAVAHYLTEHGYVPREYRDVAPFRAVDEETERERAARERKRKERNRLGPSYRSWK